MLEELNTSTFHKRLVPTGQHLLWNVAQKCAESKESTSAELNVRCESGKLLAVIVDADYVDDDLGDVKCILSMRRK